MKIHRYKIIINNTERILSVGILKDKSYSDNKLFNIETLSSGLIYDSRIGINYDIIDYSFAYAITAIGDKFNIKVEKLILDGRINSTNYCQYDLEIPIKLDNKHLTKVLAHNYARTICNTVISKFKDVKDNDIKIEDYEL